MQARGPSCISFTAAHKIYVSNILSTFCSFKFFGSSGYSGPALSKATADVQVYCTYSLKYSVCPWQYSISALYVSEASSACWRHQRWPCTRTGTARWRNDHHVTCWRVTMATSRSASVPLRTSHVYRVFLICSLSTILTETCFVRGGNNIELFSSSCCGGNWWQFHCMLIGYSLIESIASVWDQFLISNYHIWSLHSWLISRKENWTSWEKIHCWTSFTPYQILPYHRHGHFLLQSPWYNHA